MQKYLPSKKFIYTIVSILIAFLVIWAVQALSDWQAKNRTLTEAEKTALEDDQKASLQKFMATDSDGDTLKDWEEALWKTDPQKADTDGDGTSDSAEIVAVRDPLKANTAKTGQEPNDKIDPSIIAADKKMVADFNELSDTDKIAHTLFSQYIAAKGNGTLNDIDKEIILNTATAAIQSVPILNYSLSDLKVSMSVSSSSRHQYGNEFGQAFFTGTKQENVENEMIVIDRAVRNADESALKGLDPVIEGYSKTIEKILAVSVPSDAVYTHLNLLNDLLMMKNGLAKIKVAFSDPVKGIAGIREYQEGNANLIKDIAEIKNYFLDRGVTFQQDEYGYVLLNIL